ncbi:immunoglobulin-like domain-containing protein [Polaribacter sp. Hel1_85]|uniref:immunoglobulin-like domain-containing protein n=1 Tax=Polaribacter sp. Hel1_85 TaxID=1250005 RepID=UPI00052E3042|nr:immunoglobulin-like domain-containing protein [Polaribacter sp. Hel1_85]KGL63146.1 HYR domain protein-containing protein [Polaribacter sp. Hel1_85]
MKKTLLSKLVKYFLTLFFLSFIYTMSSQVTISPWKMNNGNGIIPFNVSYNGEPTAYSQMNIPAPADNNWVNAPVDSNGAINFSVPSILTQCLTQIDFTYFETYLNIPTNFNVSDLNISFTAADDGARAYIFNSAHPNGAFIGQIVFGQAPITANYASLAVPDEINRLVIAQFDSCPSGNNLTGAQVKVNGQTAVINIGGCAQSNFFWSDAPSTSFFSKETTGTINGIGYTYTSSEFIQTTSSLYSHATFPTTYNVPNNNPTIKNISSSSNTLTFNSPMTNPVLVFASIGNGGQSVPIQFNNDIEVLWSTGITIDSSTQITGTEGYAIVRMNGVFSSISFDYLADENWVNFAFGADFTTYSPDIEAPILTLNGNTTDTINAFTTYTYPSATATDNCDNNPAVLVSGTVDTNTIGSYTLTYTAVDASGNTSIPITRVVNVVDTTPPTIITQDITINLDANGNAIITPTQIDNGSNDASGSITLSLDKTNFDCSNLGINTVNLTVTDTNGNIISAPANVTIIDNIAPGNGSGSVIFTAPSTIINNVPEAANYDMVYQLNVPNTASWNTQDQVPYAVNNVAGLNGVSYNRIAYYIELDNNWVWVSLDAFTNNMNEIGIPTEAVFTGNVSNLNVFSNVPGITNGTEITTGNIEFWSNSYEKNNLNGIPGANNNTYDFGDNNNYPTDSYGSFQIHNYDQGETLFGYNRWSIGDNSDIGIGNAPYGNPDWTFFSNAATYSNKQIFVFVQSENQGNILTNDITIQLDENGNATINAIDIDGGNTDNCAIANRSLDKDTFDCSNIGTNEVLFTITDTSGNSSTATAIVTVKDVIAPIIIGKNISVTLTSSGTVSILPEDVLDNGSDNCGTITYTINQDTFTVADANNSPVTIQLTATDQSENSTVVPVLVTVIDPVPVVITQDIIVNLDENGNATISPQQIDNGSISVVGIESLELDITSFNCDNIGTPITVTLTATSTLGSIANGTAIVTILDTSVPNVVTQNIIVQLDENGNASISPEMIDNGSNDNCGIQNLNLDTTTFDCSNVGNNIVTLTVTDNNGNISTQTATVTVQDNIAPTAIAQNINIQLDVLGNASIIPSDVDNGSNDACGVSLALNTTSFTCANVGDNTVTLIVTDNNNNVSSTTATVTVIDNIAPNTIAQDITVQLDASGNVSITPEDIDNGSFDNCTFTTTIDVSSFDCSNVNVENVVTLTVRDASGNTTSTTANVTVLDSVLPDLITQNINVYLDENGNTSIVPTDIDNGSSDACGIESLVLDITSFDCANLGDNTVTLTVTDVNGNVNSQEAIITVIDNIAPIVGTQSISVTLDATGSASITPEDVLILTEDDVERGNSCIVTDAEEHAMCLDDYIKNSNGYNQRSNYKKGCNNSKHGHKNDDAFFSFDANQGTIIKNLDGSMIVTGMLVNTTDANDKWEVTLNLNNPKNWNEWSDLKRKYNGSKKTIGYSYKDWTYYELADGSKLTGIGSNAGLETEIYQKYSSYGFQLGENANLENGNYGLSGSFYYTNNKGKKEKGEFNFDISDCLQLPVPEGTVISSDNCSITSTALDINTFNCDNLGENTVQVSVKDQSGNTTTVPVIVYVLGETPVISIDEFYTVNGQKKNTVFLGYQEYTYLKTEVNGGSDFTYEWTDQNGTVISTDKHPKVSPEITSTYTVVVTNSNGCQATDSIEVCVIDARDKDRHGRFNDKVIICHHSHSHSRSCGHNSNSNTHQSNDKLISVSKNAVKGHLKHGDVLGGCDATCATEVYIEPELVTDVNIYPNPSTGYFSVKLENFENKAEILLFNLHSRLLQRRYVKDCKRENSVTMGGRWLDEGVYVVKIKTGGEIFTGSVIIERGRH